MFKSLPTGRFILVLIFVVAMLGAVTAAHAETITYTAMANGLSGTIGTTSFTDAAVTVTLVGDTTNVVSGPSGSPLSAFLVNPGATTITIGGVGTATITDAAEVISSLNPVSLSGLPNLPAVLIATLDNPEGTSITGILADFSSSFQGYDLTTSIGPITGIGIASGTESAPDPNAIHHTTMGTLVFTTNPSTATFTATVPEPSSLLLISCGLTLLVISRRRLLSEMARNI